MQLDEIKEIISLMKKNDLREFELEREGFKIRLKRAGEEAPQGAVRPIVAEVAPIATPLPMPAPVAAATPPPPSAPPSNLKEIVSPMVGTFYRSPSPDSPPYVEIGQKVDENTVVCLIEAMKVMNEIKAEVKGTIVEVLVENGKPVEFSQALFKVQPS